MTIGMFWADSKGKVSVALALLWLSAIWNQSQLSAAVFPLLAIGGSFAVDAILSRIRYGAWFFSLSSLITGLLIGLIVDPRSVATLFTAVILASVSKYFLGLGRSKHVFNPAAFGIVVSSVLLNRPVAWWGATWGAVPLLIIFLGMIVPLRQLRRLWMSVGFLFVYGIALILKTGVPSGLALTVDPTVFLFAWVMVPEPITAPSRGWWRYGWGVLVGLLAIGLTLVDFSWSDPLLIALLLANSIGFVLTRLR